MNKKLTSTILLFVVAVGCLWWGLAMLLAPGDAESKVYALLILGCSVYAFVLILRLPRKKMPAARQDEPYD
ncbi:MAG TPA: hypothetical protein VK140_00330 [Ktedonobacteraceae bacterium]|nr:hypothetical protein [Ktedonobacteraceae bacterium]